MLTTHHLSLTAEEHSITLALDEDCVADPGYAIGLVRLVGVPFHVEAVQVRFEDARLCAVNADYDSMVDDFLRLDDDRGCPQRVAFDGREWVLLVHAQLA